jgi:hypothetical protein
LLIPYVVFACSVFGSADYWTGETVILCMYCAHMQYYYLHGLLGKVGLGIFFDTNDKSGCTESSDPKPIIKVMHGYGDQAYSSYWKADRTTASQLPGEFCHAG